MKNQIQSRYRQIDVAQFAMFMENYSNRIKEVAFKTDTQFTFDKEQNVICARMDVTVLKDELPLLKVELCNYFEITADSIENIRHEDSYVFTPPILIQFASLCYGTLRGVLHVKTLGTPLNNFILPPMYFDGVIDSPFVAKV